MLKLKLQYFDHLMRRANSLEKTLMLGKIKGRRRRGWPRVRWLGGITDSMDKSMNKLQGIAKGREPWHASAHGVAKSRTRLNNNHHLRAKTQRAGTSPSLHEGCTRLQTSLTHQGADTRLKKTVI